MLLRNGSTLFENGPKIWSKFLLESGIHGPKPLGSGPSGSFLILGPDQDRKKFKKSRTSSDQDRETLRNLGPVWTRAKKILEILFGPDQENFKISDRTEPGPLKF